MAFFRSKRASVHPSEQGLLLLAVLSFNLDIPNDKVQITTMAVATIYVCVYIHTYIYIYIYRSPHRTGIATNIQHPRPSIPLLHPTPAIDNPRPPVQPPAPIVHCFTRQQSPSIPSIQSPRPPSIQPPRPSIQPVPSSREGVAWLKGAGVGLEGWMEGGWADRSRGG